MRVALLSNILPPYRIPVYRALASTPGWQLRLLLSARSEFDRVGTFEPADDTGDLDVEVVRGISRRRRLTTRGDAAAEQVVTLHVPLGALAALRRFAPDVVVSSELGARTLLAWLYCRKAGVPLVIWSYHSRVSATAAGLARRLWRRWLLSRGDAVVGMGAQARAVLRELGVPSERIFDAPNAHDPAPLARALAAPESPRRAAALRDALGCRERVALVMGRLVPVKGVERLLEAWTRLPEAVRADWSLLFVGGGPLEPRVREAAAAGPPGEIVHAPAVPANAVGDFYALADLLVFASLGDTWGLVVNEAFACGVPALCSIHAGCADDLIRPGENGWRVDPVDARELEQALARALTHPDLPLLGERARDTAKRFEPEAMAEGLRRAVLGAASRR